jgi:hypothetical protein
MNHKRAGGVRRLADNKPDARGSRSLLSFHIDVNSWENDSMKWFGARTGSFSLAVASLVLVAGCGGPGTLTGKVTFKGQPMTAGLVTVYDSSSAAQSGQIHSDGTYLVGNITPGPVKIGVKTVKARGSIMHPEDVKDPYGPYVQIPRKYADPNSSGFKTDIKTGKQEYQIEVKDDFEPGEETPKE